MYIRNEMTKDMITVTPDTTILKTMDLFNDNSFSQFPVVQDGKLVGLITEKILMDVTPSKATTLSIYEINYLLSKTKVSDVMEKNIITATPNMLLEEAAMLLRDKKIGSLPIVEDDDKLVGIITSSDITNAFIRLMGCDDKGTRIALKAEDKLGNLANITTIIKDYNINISSISIYSNEDYEAGDEIIIRLNTSEVEDVVYKLQKEGYEILDVKKY